MAHSLANEEWVVKILASKQVQQVNDMAEQARDALTRYVGYEVTYDATSAQLLDEWVDRHVRQFDDPSGKMKLLWASFLGEMFCRHHGGQWILQEKGRGGGLGVMCPTRRGGQHVIDVSGQVDRRVADGMAASLAYFYAMTAVVLKAE